MLRCKQSSSVKSAHSLLEFPGVQNRCQKHLEIAATTEGTGWTPSSMERVGGRIFSQALASCARSQTRPWVLRRRRRLRRRVRLLIITFRADASILLREFDELGNDKGESIILSASNWSTSTSRSSVGLEPESGS